MLNPVSIPYHRCNCSIQKFPLESSEVKKFPLESPDHKCHNCSCHWSAHARKKEYEHWKDCEHVEISKRELDRNCGWKCRVQKQERSCCDCVCVCRHCLDCGDHATAQSVLSFIVVSKHNLHFSIINGIPGFVLTFYYLGLASWQGVDLDKHVRHTKMYGFIWCLLKLK